MVCLAGYLYKIPWALAAEKAADLQDLGPMQGHLRNEDSTSWQEALVLRRNLRAG